MQMDVNLAGGCGTLSPQWYVKCDVGEESKLAVGPLDGFSVVTSEGVVVSDGHEHISVGADLDLVELFIS